jgi:hypothetical protein
MPLSAMIDAVRVPWAGMDNRERAFLIYCLLRLRRQLEASAPETRLPQPETV